MIIIVNIIIVKFLNWFTTVNGAVHLNYFPRRSNMKHPQSQETQHITAISDL